MTMMRPATRNQLEEIRVLLESIIEQAKALEIARLAHTEEGERWPFVKSPATTIDALYDICDELSDMELV